MSGSLGAATALLGRLDRTMGSVERAVVGVCLMASAVMSFLLVAGRYVFSLNLSFFEELSVYLVIWMAFLGAAMADRGRQHIAIDIVHHLLPPRALGRLLRGVDLAKAVVGLMMAWLALEEVRFSASIGERSVSALEAPIWVVMAVMPLAFLMIGLRNLVAVLAPRPPAGAPPGPSSFE